MASTSTTTLEPRQIKLGEATVTYPSAFIQELQDSKSLYDTGDFTGLRERFAQDGYLYIKQGLSREAVLKARSLVIQHLKEKADVLVQGKEEEGVLLERCMAGCVPFMEGQNHLTHSPEVLEVLAGPRITSLMEAVLGGDSSGNTAKTTTDKTIPPPPSSIPASGAGEQKSSSSSVVTFDFKWLRAGWNSFFTGAHVDRVYMGRGSQNVITTWIPFDDATCELGALAILEGSHRMNGRFKHFQETYGELDVERDNFDGTGWFTSNPHEVQAMGLVGTEKESSTEEAAGKRSDDGGGNVQWRITDYQAGDIVMFGMRTVHMSTANTTDRVRISCDIRWQPAQDARDDRYFGDVATKVKQRQKAGAWVNDDDDVKGNKEVPGAETVAAVKVETKRTIADMKKIWGFADAA